MTGEATPSSTPARAPGPVDRAFALLQIVAASEQAIGVRELARRAGLAPSTTTRTLGILSDLGMIERTPSGAARPGPALATLTRHVDQSPASLRDRLRPLAFNLSNDHGENAAITVDDGAGVLYVAGSRVAGALQVPDPTDATYPFHLVAPGLVTMSHWAADRLDTYLAQPLAAATPRSITDAGRIRSRVGAIREAGHAWTDQELDLDVNGIAVPVLDRSGELVATASLYGPAHRLNPVERPELAAQLIDDVRQRTADLW